MMITINVITSAFISIGKPPKAIGLNKRELEKTKISPFFAYQVLTNKRFACIFLKRKFATSLLADRFFRLRGGQPNFVQFVFIDMVQKRLDQLAESVFARFASDDDLHGSPSLGFFNFGQVKRHHATIEYMRHQGFQAIDRKIHAPIGIGCEKVEK